MLIAYILVQAYISTHSLTRRLTIIPPRHTATVSYFNSQPHKEADYIDIILQQFNTISTHSLTRRLTAATVTRNLILFIFQLTASQGG